MTSLAARVLHTARTRGLITGGDRIVVAVSGGADSVALAHLLVEIAPSLDASVTGVAHLNHRLRGADADGDQAFVAALAENLGLPFLVSFEDVGALARQRRVSIERAGHDARRAFYAWALASAGASRLATGHTADDQAETVLLRLIRGAGTKGLGGIHPGHAHVIRPLIDTTRAEVRRHLLARHLSWREDASNDDPAIARNRVRGELVPLLRERFSPAVVRTLARTADILRDDDSYLEEAATAAARSIVLVAESGVSLDRAGLASLPTPLARRVVRHALRALGREQSIGVRHVEQVLGVARGPRRVELALPGALAVAEGGRIELRTSPPPAEWSPATQGAEVALAELVIPGETEVPALDLRIAATWVTENAAGAVVDKTTAPDVVVLDARAAEGGLFVRTRRPGDRLRPAGFGGHKKLQDLFVDRKVPRSVRDRVPVVVDRRGAVVWVVGHAVSDAFVPRENVSSVLLLKVKAARRIG